MGLNKAVIDVGGRDGVYKEDEDGVEEVVDGSWNEGSVASGSQWKHSTPFSGTEVHLGSSRYPTFQSTLHGLFFIDAFLSKTGSRGLLDLSSLLG